MNTDNSRRDSLDRSQTSLSSLDFGKPKGWPSYGNIGESTHYSYFSLFYILLIILCVYSTICLFVYNLFDYL